MGTLSWYSVCTQTLRLTQPPTLSRTGNEAKSKVTCSWVGNRRFLQAVTSSNLQAQWSYKGRWSHPAYTLL